VRYPGESGPEYKTNECRGISTLYGSLPDKDDGHNHDTQVVQAMGISLLGGFALMLL
jgi:hypothetical protein